VKKSWNAVCFYFTSSSLVVKPFTRAAKIQEKRIKFNFYAEMNKQDENNLLAFV